MHSSSSRRRRESRSISPVQGSVRNKELRRLLSLSNGSSGNKNRTGDKLDKTSGLSRRKGKHEAQSNSKSSKNPSIDNVKEHDVQHGRIGEKLRERNSRRLERLLSRQESSSNNRAGREEVFHVTDSRHRIEMEIVKKNSRKSHSGGGRTSTTSRSERPASRNSRMTQSERPASRNSRTKTQSERPASRNSRTKTQSERPASRNSRTKTQSERPSSRNSRTKTQSERPSSRNSRTKTQSERPSSRNSRTTIQSERPSSRNSRSSHNKSTSESKKKVERPSSRSTRSRGGSSSVTDRNGFDKNSIRSCSRNSRSRSGKSSSRTRSVSRAPSSRLRSSTPSRSICLEKSLEELDGAKKSHPRFSLSATNTDFYDLQQHFSKHTDVETYESASSVKSYSVASSCSGFSRSESQVSMISNLEELDQAVHSATEKANGQHRSGSTGGGKYSRRSSSTPKGRLGRFVGEGSGISRTSRVKQKKKSSNCSLSVGSNDSKISLGMMSTDDILSELRSTTSSNSLGPSKQKYHYSSKSVGRGSSRSVRSGSRSVNSNIESRMSLKEVLRQSRDVLKEASDFRNQQLKQLASELTPSSNISIKGTENDISSIVSGLSRGSRSQFSRSKSCGNVESGTNGSRTDDIIVNAEHHFLDSLATSFGGDIVKPSSPAPSHIHSISVESSKSVPSTLVYDESQKQSSNVIHPSIAHTNNSVSGASSNSNKNQDDSKLKSKDQHNSDATTISKKIFDPWSVSDKSNLKKDNGNISDGLMDPFGINTSFGATSNADWSSVKDIASDTFDPFFDGEVTGNTTMMDISIDGVDTKNTTVLSYSKGESMDDFFGDGIDMFSDLSMSAVGNDARNKDKKSDKKTQKTNLEDYNYATKEKKDVFFSDFSGKWENCVGKGKSKRLQVADINETHSDETGFVDCSGAVDDEKARFMMGFASDLAKNTSLDTWDSTQLESTFDKKSDIKSSETFFSNMSKTEGKSKGKNNSFNPWSVSEFPEDCFSSQGNSENLFSDFGFNGPLHGRKKDKAEAKGGSNRSKIKSEVVQEVKSTSKIKNNVVSWSIGNKKKTSTDKTKSLSKKISALVSPGRTNSGAGASCAESSTDTEKSPVSVAVTEDQWKR